MVLYRIKMVWGLRRPRSRRQHSTSKSVFYARCAAV